MINLSIACLQPSFMEHLIGNGQRALRGRILHEDRIGSVTSLEAL